MSSEPHSLLFLSCDLVGSTSFKQSEINWQATFLSFYRQFPQSLAKLVDPEHGLSFDLWKPIGDELIFTVRVQHERDILRAVRTWLLALDEYEQGALSKVSGKLATKGGAFVATFPGPDSEATVPRNLEVERSDQDVVQLNRQALRGPRKHTKYVYDYFGPSIDTGFRILGACSRRFFSLSVEVAWAMQRAARDENVRLEDLVWHDGRSLKGVWGGREYPVFALDREYADPVNRALRSFHAAELSPDKVEEVCRACYASPGWPSALYLSSSGFEPFKRQPVDPLEADEVVDTGGPTLRGLEQRVELTSEGQALPQDPPMPDRAV